MASRIGSFTVFVTILCLNLCKGGSSAAASCEPSYINEGALQGQQCQVLNKVCVDQETIITYDDQYVKEPTGDALPKIVTDNLQFWWRHDIPKRFWKSKRSHVTGTSFPYNRVYLRLPAAQEEGLTKEDLDNFSTCTVPVVIFQHWSMNLGEFYARSVVFSWLFQNYEPLALDSRISIVLANPGKTPLQPFNTFLLQPFSNYSVTSFANFSSRLPASTPSSNTAEGTHMRCFNKMVVCTFAGGRYPQMYEAAHTIMDYYKPKLPPVETFWKDLSNTTLRILFETRPNLAARQILNMKELLKWCNEGGMKLGNSTYTKVECATHTTGKDQLSDVSIASAADIFVALHGAGMMNALYMKPYSTVLELRQFEFGSKHGRGMTAFWWPMMSAQNSYKFFFWGLNLDEPDTWKASELEDVPNHGLNEVTRSQMRHVILRFDLLQFMIDKILSMKKNATLYDVEFKAHQVLYTAANGTMTATRLWD